MERNNDRLTAGSSLFDQGVSDALGDLSLLVGRATFQHCDLNERHRKPSLVVCRWRSRSVDLDLLTSIDQRLTTILPVHILRRKSSVRSGLFLRRRNREWRCTRCWLPISCGSCLLRRSLDWWLPSAYVDRQWRFLFPGRGPR